MKNIGDNQLNDIRHGLAPLSTFETLILNEGGSDDDSEGEEEESHPSMDKLLDINEPVNNIDEYEPMGVYDNICMKDALEDKEGHQYYTDNIINMYTGADVRKDEDLEKFPTIDGDEKSPRKMSIFLNNKVDPECCTDSMYTTSSGCVCLTNDQKKNLYNRAGNK